MYLQLHRTAAEGQEDSGGECGGAHYAYDTADRNLLVRADGRLDQSNSQLACRTFLRGTLIPRKAEAGGE